MLYTPYTAANSISTTYSAGVAGTFPGATITPATTDAWGTYVALTTAPITDNAYGIQININASTSTILAVKIGIDPAGGTSYTDFITNLICPNPGAAGILGGCYFFFPMFVPAGATIAASARSSTASTAIVNVRLYSKHGNREHVGRVASYMESVGVTLGAGTATGVSVTPGTTSEGAWTSVGTTTRNNWWWQIGWLPPSAANMYLIDVAVGDGTNFSPIFTDLMVVGSPGRHPQQVGCIRDVPAGSAIYARIQSSLSTGITNFSVLGCGG